MLDQKKPTTFCGGRGASPLPMLNRPATGAVAIALATFLVLGFVALALDAVEQLGGCDDVFEDVGWTVHFCRKSIEA